jgi:hypothetical protein
MSCKKNKPVVDPGPGLLGKKAATGRSVILNREWLSLNAGKYLEEWVALRDGKLIDHDTCSRTLRKRLRDNKVLTNGLLIIVPGHFYTEQNELIW